MAASKGTVTDGTEVVKFVGGVSVSGWGFTGFNGSGAVLVGSEGIEFRLNDPFGLIAHRYVKRSDLGKVYPVQARRLSLASLVAAIVPHISNTGVRFLTPPSGMFADRDVYSCFPYNSEQPKLIHLLDELGYPVDRNVRTYRMHWSLEV
jgi:hypothetical protein